MSGRTTFWFNHGMGGVVGECGGGGWEGEGEDNEWMQWVIRSPSRQLPTIKIGHILSRQDNYTLPPPSTQCLESHQKRAIFQIRIKRIICSFLGVLRQFGFCRPHDTPSLKKTKYERSFFASIFKLNCATWFITSVIPKNRVEHQKEGWGVFNRLFSFQLSFRETFWLLALITNFNKKTQIKQIKSWKHHHKNQKLIILKIIKMCCTTIVKLSCCTPIKHNFVKKTWFWRMLHNYNEMTMQDVQQYSCN